VPRVRRAAIALFALVALPTMALDTRVEGQAYPTKPVSIVVPFAAGGASDLVLRAFIETAPAFLGQPVVVQMRPGGGGAIASDLVARAKPDGYTLLFGHSNSNSILPAIEGRSKGPDDSPRRLAHDLHGRLLAEASLLRSSIAAIVLAMAPDAFAQPAATWLPAAAEEQAARVLAQQMSGLSAAAGRPSEQLLEGARQAVQGVGERLEGLGVEGVIRLAPAFTNYNAPLLSHPILTAMSRYALCRFPMEVVAEDVSLDKEMPAQRVAATIGLLWLDAANLYLRFHYHTQGGTERQIEQQLSLEPIESLAARVQTDVETAQDVANQCGPVLEQFMQ
jgi:hypothetical protein